MEIKKTASTFLDIIETSKTHNCGYIFISLLIFSYISLCFSVIFLNVFSVIFPIFSYIFLCFPIFSYVLNCGICVQRMCESNGSLSRGS